MHKTQILVGCIELDSTDPVENAMLVSEAERQRATRYRRALDGRRFLARRAQTRLILAEIVHKPAQDIAFSLGAFGKPDIQESSIRFSTSHSDGLLLIAIGTDRELGCDIEHRDPNQDLAMLAQMTFTDHEKHWFAAIHEGLKMDAFYDRWTCKEAYLKAIGTGLSIPMTDFAIVTEPFQIVTRTGFRDDWSAHSWRPRSEHHAAIVAQGKDWHVEELDFLTLCRSNASPTLPVPCGRIVTPY